MDALAIENIFRKLGMPRVKNYYFKVTTNCPILSKHEGGDQNPSMVVFATDPGKKSYCHCSSCGFKGTVQNLLGTLGASTDLNLSELINKVARIEAGMDRVRITSAEDYEMVPNIVRYPSLMKHYKDIVQNNIKEITVEQVEEMIAPWLNKVPRYFLDRGFDVETAKAWGLGSMTNHRILKNKNGKLYYTDFGNRLLFVVRDQDGRAVGWSARATTSDEKLKSEKAFDGTPIYIMQGKPKYLHCPGWMKKNWLYGEHMIDKTSDTCFLVEGFFDVINLWRHGVTNCFAIMGADLSKKQADKICAMFKRCVIIPDGDEAGINSMNNSKKLLQDKLILLFLSFFVF